MMVTLKNILVLFFVFAARADDEFHPKPNSVDPALEIVNIKPLLKTNEGNSLFWTDNAQKYLEDQLKLTKNTKKAKNLIMFLGDGMSISTIAATRMYLGGEELKLSFETFPHYGLVKPYCVDRQVPDSACTATAFLGGIKNNYRGIGVTANVSSTQCNFSEEDVVYSIVKWAQDEGKATGVVTTTRITHATPAAAYAHSPHRDWENNAVISSACRNDPNSQIKDIAHQLVYNEEAKKLKVIMGGGTRHMLNNTMQNDEGRFGERTDGRNLIDEWLEERNKEGKATYISHKQQLDELDVDKTDFLLGLFEHDHCMYRLDVLNNKLENQEPLLTQMTETAIKMLQKEENGFFLLVEGGRIDHAHHSNYARKSLDETAEFARAIELARLMTSDDDTLIVVTSDHSHVFTYSGYPYRHDDVLKTTGYGARDGLHFETLSYANGPGYNRTYGNEGNRSNIIDDDFTHVSRRYSAMVPLSSETHGGDDVNVYSVGPWSHLFQGSYEQSDIPLVMAYAAKIGPYADRVENTTPCTGSDCDSANGVFLTSILLFLSLVVVFFT